MKQYIGLLLAVIVLLGLSVGAGAQARREAVVTIPFEFVAGGKALPAGMYTLDTTGNGASSLLLSNYEDRTGAFVLPAEVESSSADKVTLSFETVGGTRFLSKVQTITGVYNITLPRSAVFAAQMKHEVGSASAGK